MRVLALDTTTRAGSVAVVDNGVVVVARSGDSARSHAERLPQDILDALHDAGLDGAAIDLYAVAAGPGMFTGLRIGIATMQGLAFVHRRKIAAVSALRALAEHAAREAGPGTTVAAWMDAHRRDVFAAAYRVDAAAIPPGTARLVEVAAPTVDAPGPTLERWRAAGVRPGVICGDGAVLFEAVVARQARVLPAPPLAPILAALALDAHAAGLTMAPAAVQPLYVRRPDAEVARETRAALEP